MVALSTKFALLFGVRYELDLYGYDPCDEWDIDTVMSLPDGLWYRDGRINYHCENCGEASEWPVEICDFEYGHPHNVCGRSPRCCP